MLAQAAGLSFAVGSDLSIGIFGPAVDADYDQLNVIGQVDLSGVDLLLSGALCSGDRQ